MQRKTFRQLRRKLPRDIISDDQIITLAKFRGFEIMELRLQAIESEYGSVDYSDSEIDNHRIVLAGEKIQFARESHSENPLFDEEETKLFEKCYKKSDIKKFEEYLRQKSVEIYGKVDRYWTWLQNNKGWKTKTPEIKAYVKKIRRCVFGPSKARTMLASLGRFGKSRKSKGKDKRKGTAKKGKGGKKKRRRRKSDSYII